MSGGQLDTVLRHLRKLVGGPEAEDSDGRLLERFLDRRDESAFAALLARHGPMVWGVCRRLLPEPHDAEDAFQATFLVLVRRARALDRRGSLAGWLHAVAGRVALRARSGRGRERPLTEEVPAMNATDPADEAARRELRALIDEELRRLPEKYRGAVLLCDVQGRSHEEAARQLGCPPGSMSWRLARGRELLRQGLLRRGVAPPAALLTGLLAEDAGAAVPAALAEATTRLALVVAAGGALSGPTAALVDGTVRALAPARLKLVAALLALGLLAAGAGVATHRALTAEHPATAPPGDVAKNDEPPPPPAPPKNAENKPEPAPPPVEKPAPRVDAQGDPLPPGAVARLGTLRLRQSDGVSAFAFSPDGKLLATGGGDDDQWLHVWDVETGKLVQRLPEHGVTLVAFSPDAKTLAVASSADFGTTHTYRLWDVETGKERLRLNQLHRSASALAFSPDGKTLFACGWEHVSTWDTKTGEAGKTFVNGRGPPGAFALAPDGKRIAAIVEDAKKVVLVATNGDSPIEFQKRDQQFRSLAFSPDGKRLAVAVDDAPAVILDAATMKELVTAEAPRPERSVETAFSADGKELLIVDNKYRLWSWDALTGKFLRTRPSLADSISAAALSPDRKLVAFTERQDQSDQHSLRVVELATGKDCLRLGGHETTVNTVAFSPDGRLLASTGIDGVTFLWDLAARHEVWRVVPKGGTVGASAFAPAGDVLAALGSSGHLELFEVATRKSLATFDTDTGYCRSVAFSFDGKTLARVGARQDVWFGTVNGSQIQGRIIPSLKADQIALDRAGRLAAATRGGAWLDNLSGTAEPRWLPVGKGSSPTSVAVAPAGDTVAVGSREEGIVCLFDAATGAKRREVRHEPLRSVALSPLGRILAVGGAKGSVTLFDAATGKELLSVTGHEGPVTALAFSEDGCFLASAGGDTTVLVWDLDQVFRHAPKPDSLNDASLSELWDDLAGADPTSVLWTVAALASDPARTVAFFGGRLKPVASDHDERLRRAIADLRDEDYKVRERAMEELRRFGPEAIPPLRELQRTATDPRLQARLRAFLTMAELSGVTRLPVVPREVWAVQVLERIGTPEARQLVEELAKGAPTARLTEAAKAALGRWPR